MLITLKCLPWLQTQWSCVVDIKVLVTSYYSHVMVIPHRYIQHVLNVYVGTTSLFTVLQRVTTESVQICSQHFPTRVSRSNLRTFVLTLWQTI